MHQLVAFGVFLGCIAPAQAQISLTTLSPTATENFDGIATSTLPSSWKVTHSFTALTTAATTASTTVTVASTANLVAGMAVTGTGVPGGATIAGITNGTQFTLSASATIASGATLLFTNGNTVTWANTANRTTTTSTNATPGTATGNSYVYTAGVPAGTDKAVGIQTSATFANPQSIMAQYRNNSGATLTDLSVSFSVERYRIATQTAQVDFFYSTDGSSWTAVPAGNVSTAELPTGANAFTFGGATPPLIVTKTANITGLSVPSGVTGNIYLRWNFNLNPTPTQAVSIDDVSVTATFLACTTPTNQPTALTFPSVGTAQISGSFTAASGSPNGYLVVRYPAGSPTTAPSNGVIYTTGNALGAGTVVSSAAGTTFTATGLAVGTNYDFYVYAYNSTSCVGPAYRTSAPLFASQATGSCASLSPTIQIDPAGAVVFGTSYQTITDALNDLSGCPITQPTVIELQNNYVSSGETFPITLGAITGASASNTVTIRPAAGATNLSITGAPTGLPIIDINGGSWWRVDGRPGGAGTSQQLTIMNTDNTTIGSSAVRLINGSQNNVVTYLKARSANIGVAGGSINISSGTLSAGNSNNTISNCDVYNSTGGIPNVGIGAVGLNTANDGNSILNNNIYDFFNPTGNSYGIYISDLNTNWTISGNSIYQTAPRTLTGGAADRIFSPIGISPTTASTVNGLTISGNFIGGTAPNCGGSALTISDVAGVSTLVFRGIFVQVGTTVAASIQGNTIRNITINSSSTSSNHSCISAVSGSINIGTLTGNTLGSTTVNQSVNLTVNSTSNTARLSGILAGTGTPGSMNIANNTIAGLSITNSNSGSASLAGIYLTGAATGYSVLLNTIGSSSLSNSMQCSATTAVNNQDTWGIYLGTGTASTSISSNTIQNFNSGLSRFIGIRADGGSNGIGVNTIRNCTSASSGLTGCIGIWSNSTTAGQLIRLNTIHSLENTDASAATAVHGIYFTGPTSGTNSIENNFVHSLKLSTNNTTGAIYGIRVLVGVFPVNIQNNMVRLGIDASGSDITTGYSIFGIGNASTGTINHYFNTIYIGGTGVSGTTSSTYALLTSSTGNTRTIQNNILVNTQDGGTTGKHYAFQVSGSGVNPAGLTMNNNLYQTTGGNGFLGLYGTDLTDLVAIQAAIGQNTNSYICDPKLIAPDANAASVDLHIQPLPATTLIESKGSPVVGLGFDIDGNVRSTVSATDIGADEGNFGLLANCNTVLTWNGSSSNVWGTPANWTPAQAPTATTPVIIPGVATQPAITGSVNALSLTLQGTASPSISAGGVLNVKENLSGVSTAAITGDGKVVLNGTALQTISGTVTLSNVDFANTTVAGVEILAGGTLKIQPSAATGSGLVTFLANSKLTNNGTFVLGSNNLGTAKIGPIPTTASISGEITQERYLPYTTGAGTWYFLGTPFSGKNFTDLVDDFRVVGLSSGFGVQGSGIISSPEPERSTIFKYDETLHNVRTDTAQKLGWRIPGNENLNPGAGYRVWVNFHSNASHKVDYAGTLTRGDFTFPAMTHNDLSGPGCIPASFPCNEAGTRGWNLLANPYPCDLNWDATGANTWTKPAQMNNAFYTWNAAANSYRAYLGTTGTPGVSLGGSTASSTNTNPNVIPSGQAFFVKITTPGSFNLQVGENAKSTSGAGTFTRTAVTGNQVRIRLSKMGSDARYDAMLRLAEGATDGFDQGMDLEAFAGSNFEFSFDHNLLLQTLAPSAETRILPLHMKYAGQMGTYSLGFSELEGLLENNSLYLRDLLTGTMQAIQPGFEYAYSVTSSDALTSDRFELVLSPEAVTGSVKGSPSFPVALIPNPSQNGTQAHIQVGSSEGADVQVVVTDALGRKVWESTASGTYGQTQIALSNRLAPGMYQVQVLSGSKSAILKWMVK